MKDCMLAVVIAILVMHAVQAQPTAPQPQFEVASIKLNTAGLEVPGTEGLTGAGDDLIGRQPASGKDVHPGPPLCDNYITTRVVGMPADEKWTLFH